MRGYLQRIFHTFPETIQFLSRGNMCLPIVSNSYHIARYPGQSAYAFLEKD